MPPSRCTQRFGKTRSEATSVPTAMAIRNEIATIRTVTQKPAARSGNASRRTSHSPVTSAADYSASASSRVIVGGSCLSSVYWPIHSWYRAAQRPSAFMSAMTPFTSSCIAASPSLMPAP